MPDATPPSATADSALPAPPLDKLVQLLVKLEGPPQDRGALSALRSWWRPVSRHLAMPVMADLLARCGVGTQRLDDPVWTALPALFAWHRRHEADGRSNFGTACRKLAGDQRETFDTHFRRVLAAERVSDLVGVIRRHLLRAATEGVSLDYKQLGIDLLQWRKSPEDARDVKVRWAKEYFRAPAEEPAPATP
jgi:CRISPR type I-E-associated protein CasB/Cse2